MAQQPEQRPANLRPLLAALATGAIVVIAYNAHITSVRRAGQGEMVGVLKVNRDIPPGETLTRRDVEIIRVRREHKEALGDVVPATDKDMDYLIGTDAAPGEEVERLVPKGDFLRWTHFEADLASSVGKPRTGHVSAVLNIDQDYAPGDFLGPGDYINVIGVASVGNEPPRTYELVKWVRVLAIAGKGRRDSMDGTGSVSRTQYKQVAIEIRDDEALPLNNLLTHVPESSLRIQVLPPSANQPRDAGRINPALVPLTKSARTVGTSSRGGGRPGSYSGSLGR